jgi:hypothetical protein
MEVSSGPPFMVFIEILAEFAIGKDRYKPYPLQTKPFVSDESTKFGKFGIVGSIQPAKPSFTAL